MASSPGWGGYPGDGTPQASQQAYAMQQAYAQYYASAMAASASLTTPQAATPARAPWGSPPFASTGPTTATPTAPSHATPHTLTPHTPTPHALAPRKPRDKLVLGARRVPDVAWAPTPQVSLTSDVGVPRGSASVVNASYLPVPQGRRGEVPGDDGAGAAPYMYSLDSTAEALAATNERAVLQETRVKELEKEVRLAQRESKLLAEQLEDAFDRAEDAEVELRHQQALEASLRRRAPVRAPLGAPGFSIVSLPTTAPADPVFMLRLLRRVAFFSWLPTHVLREVVHHAKVITVGAGSSLAAPPRARRSLCVVLAGTAVSVAGGANLFVGDYFGEHNLLGRSAVSGRDLVDWEAVSPLTALAVSSRLFRRLALSESAVLNTWTPGDVATLLAPTFSILQPPPRLLLAPGALRTHVDTTRALLSVATMPLNETQSAAAEAALAGELPSAPHSDSSGSEDDAGSRGGGGDGVPPVLYATAGLLLRMQEAMAPKAVGERCFQAAVAALGAYFGADAALLYDVDGEAGTATRLLGPPSTADVVRPLDGLLRIAAADGEVLTVAVAEDARYVHEVDAPPVGRRTTVRHLAYVPVSESGAVEAVVVLVNTARGGGFTPRDAHLLRQGGAVLGEHLAQSCQQLAAAVSPGAAPLARQTMTVAFRAGAVVLNSRPTAPQDSVWVSVRAALCSGRSLVTGWGETAATRALSGAASGRVGASADDTPLSGPFVGRWAPDGPWCDLGVPLREVPRGTRLVVSVVVEDAPHAQYWAALPAAPSDGEWVTVPLAAGEWPAPGLPSCDDAVPSAPAGTVTLQLRPVPDAVPVDADLARGVWWRRMAARLAPELVADVATPATDEDLLWDDQPPAVPGATIDVAAALGAPHAHDVWSPQVLSPADRATVWGARRRLGAHPGLLPVVLRALPLSGADVSAHTLALLRRHTVLPPHVSLQLLDGTFADPTVRAAAVDGLAALPLSALLPLVPAVVPCVAWEPALDSALVRLLLRRTAAAPSTFGRQLFWAAAALRSAAGLDERCLALQRAVLDACDEVVTCELGLQALALAQVATACRAPLSAHRDARRAALMDGLKSAVLPHTFRLPLAAQAPFVPSAISASGTQEDVEAGLQTVLASLGVLSVPPPGGDGAPETSLPAGGLPVSALRGERSRVLYCNARRRTVRSLLVFRAGREADAARVVTATAGSTAAAVRGGGAGGDGVAYSGGAAWDVTEAGVVALPPSTPRPLNFYNGEVCVVGLAADDVAVLVHATHARVANAMAATWREAGMPVGDAVPPYVCGVHPAAGVDGPPRLFGVMLAHPHAHTLAEVLTMPDDDLVGAPPHADSANTLQRWFMTSLFNTYAADQGGAAADGAYEEVVHRFQLGLAGVLVACYTLALGTRRAADLAVSPQGFVQLLDLGFTDQVPNRCLAGGLGGAPPPGPPRLGAAGLVADVLGMLGQHPGCATVDPATVPSLAAARLPRVAPMVAQLLLIAQDAFLAVRRQAAQVVALVGASTPLKLPTAATVADVGAFKARLLLGMSDVDAAASFTRTVATMLHIL